MSETSEATAGPSIAPFGSWRSSIPIDLLVSGLVPLREPALDGQDIYWIEGRPNEGGRQVIVRMNPDGSIVDITPPGVNARTRVHEYGGSAYAVHDGVVFFSNFRDGRLYRQDRGREPRPITPEGQFRYADFEIDDARGRLIGVREDHSGPGEPENSLVSVPLEGGDIAPIAGGSDFYAAPRLSPDGDHLAYLCWDHPNLPWDGTQLRVAHVGSVGLGHDDLVAGGADEWIAQPRWSPQGILHFVSERTGWMNLYRWVDGRVEPVAPMPAEFAHADWVFGLSTYGFAGDGGVLAVGRGDGHDRLYVIGSAGAPSLVDVPFTEMEYVRVAGDWAVFVGGGPIRFQSMVRLALRDGSWTILRRSTSAHLNPADVSVAHHIEFATMGGRTAHALFYPPSNHAFEGPPGELPPLIVTSHGGPTSAASTTLSITTQLFTSRGFAVLDVDYGGSTGYGRDYRKRLEGTWGITDVDDCVAGARHLAEGGLVDPGRLAIRGGSASGYTTLCALAFRGDFRAGVSYFGIGDLETFVAATHKFESRYLDRLIGPYPERADIYRDRSPLSAADRISCPVLVLQGLDDRVVPPSQAEEIVAGLRANNVPFAYLAFEGEDHGFRQGPNIIRSFEAELSFYGQVFGFTSADAIEPITIEGLDAWRSARAGT